MVEMLLGGTINGVYQDGFGNTYILINDNTIMTLERVYPYPSAIDGYTVRIEINPDKFDEIKLKCANRVEGGLE